MGEIIVGKYYHKRNEPGLMRYLQQSRHLYRCLHLRARQGAALARALAPSDSGVYRASIHVEAGRRAFDGRMVALIVADAPYAVQVEHGRTKTKPYRGARVLSRIPPILNTPERSRRV